METKYCRAVVGSLLVVSLLTSLFADSSINLTLKEDKDIILPGTDLKDLEGLAYVPFDETIWIADDDLSAIIEVDCITGVVKSTLDENDFVNATYLNNSSNPQNETAANGGSHVDELETIGFDSTTGSLYVINTVNDPSLNPPKDIATIFKLSKPEKDEAFVFDDWQELPTAGSHKFTAMVVINGEILISDSDDLFTYDFSSNSIASQAIDFSPNIPTSGTVSGLSFDGTFLWVLKRSGEKVHKVYWDTITPVATYDVSSLFTETRGIAVSEDRIYIGESSAS